MSYGTPCLAHSNFYLINQLSASKAKGQTVQKIHAQIIIETEINFTRTWHKHSLTHRYGEMVI